MVKRAVDLALTSGALVALAPLLLLVALAIKLDSAGPVLYSQTRIGRCGRPFRLYKFRSMLADADRTGSPLTGRNDPRVTRLGRVLRPSRLDELPQLFNVLRGDMSLVGPRPEVPSIVDRYTRVERQVLSVRPGLVGPTHVAWLDETERYPEGVDPVEYYIAHMLPEKLRSDLEYVRTRSLLTDFWCLARVPAALLRHALGRRPMEARVCTTGEEARIERAYSRRATRVWTRLAMRARKADQFRVDERDARQRAMLARHGLLPLGDIEILEVGCGAGHELEKLTELGGDRARLHGIDILVRYIAEGKARAPDLDLRHGDARSLPWPDGAFDLVMCYTVFTSILDAGIRRAVAREMVRVLAPTGYILWYDFRYNNPFNPDVRKVTRDDLVWLFPDSRMYLEDVTLAPPIARVLVPLLPRLAVWAQDRRLFSTHLLGLIQPRGSSAIQAA